MTQATKGVRKRVSCLKPASESLGVLVKQFQGPTTESISLGLALKYAHAIGISVAGRSQIHPASKNTVFEKVEGGALGERRRKGRTTRERTK